MADHHQREYDEHRRARREWSERAGDEVRSWFGDDEARMRRAQDEREERYRDDRHDYREGRPYEAGRGARGPEWGGRYDEPRGPGGSSWSGREAGGSGSGRGYYGQSWRGGEAGRGAGDGPGRPRWQSTFDEPRWGQDTASWRQSEIGGSRYAGDREPAGFSGGYGGYGGYGGSGGGYGSGGYGGRSYAGPGDASWAGEYGSESSRYRDDEYGGSGPRRGDGQRARVGFSGRGPKDYQRSDERIREEISDRMTDDPWLDASEITVAVAHGEVTLAGTVTDREQKRRAEDLAESISGVREVTNNIRVVREDSSDRGQSTSATQAGQLGEPSGRPKSAGTGTTS